jgi:hypothetical protein
VIYKSEFKGSRPTAFPYYACYEAKQKRCPRRNVRADEIDALISDIILTKIGARQVLRREYVPAEDHAERLTYIQRLIEELDEDRRTGVERTLSGTGVRRRR